MIVKKKEETSLEELIPEDMPTEFSLFYDHCRFLQFAERPDYGYLHRLLRDMVCAESFTQVLAFQWLVNE